MLPLGAADQRPGAGGTRLLHVPLAVSLAIVIAAGLGGCAVTLRGHTRERKAPAPTGAGERRLLRLLLPLRSPALVGADLAAPDLPGRLRHRPGSERRRDPGRGDRDALEHAPPTATRPDLPITTIPLQWRSKYPIYYPLAAASELAGSDPIQAFATVAALMLALGAWGSSCSRRAAARAALGRRARRVPGAARPDRHVRDDPPVLQRAVGTVHAAVHVPGGVAVPARSEPRAPRRCSRCSRFSGCSPTRSCFRSRCCSSVAYAAGGLPPATGSGRARRAGSRGSRSPACCGRAWAVAAGVSRGAGRCRSSAAVSSRRCRRPRPCSRRGRVWPAGTASALALPPLAPVRRDARGRVAGLVGLVASAAWRPLGLRSVPRASRVAAGGDGRRHRR